MRVRDAVARLIAQNLKNNELASPIYHIETLTVDYEFGKFEVDIASTTSFISRA